VEGFGVEPKAIDSTAEMVCFARSEEAATVAVGAGPFMSRVDEYEFVGNAADREKTLEKSKRLRGCWAWEVHRLAGVLCYEADSVVDGA